MDQPTPSCGGEGVIPALDNCKVCKDNACDFHPCPGCKDCSEPKDDKRHYVPGMAEKFLPPNDDRCGTCGKEKCYLTWCEEPCEGACRTMNTPDQCHGHPKQEGKEHSDACADSPMKECNPDCPARQDGKECEVYGPNEGGPAGVCKEHSHVDAVCPTPKSGGMEERFDRYYNCKASNAKCLSCADIPQLKDFIRSELSRQEKELNERWEGRMARVREAVVLSCHAKDCRIRRGKKCHCHMHEALHPQIAAFDQAAALKE